MAGRTPSKLLVVALLVAVTLAAYAPLFGNGFVNYDDDLYITNNHHVRSGLEAESVAYVACRHFGLDTDVRSSRYIALWGGDAKSLRESLERIAKTARDLIDDVQAADSRKAVA